MIEHKGIWILAEQSGGKVLRVSHELITRGRELAAKRGCELTAVIFGNEIDEAGLQGLLDRGCDRVIAVEAAELEHFLPEPYARCLQKLIEDRKPEILIAAATTTGRTVLPYVAIKVNAGLTADCTVLDIEEETGNLLQTRPAIGGNILATIKTPEHRPQMATVRPRSTKPAPVIEAGRPGEIERMTAPADLLDSRITRTGFEPLDEEHNIEDADRVVCCGRGIKKGENLSLIYTLAEQLDAAVGATRDVVDRGWLSYPHQIGLSGKTVTPTLYIGIGASGSIQHLAGMQTAENIVVINSDPEAQLFRVADIGIVGNLFDVLPVLSEKLQAAKGGDA
jgi:electron transfer flavoprotein alpha subunit